jgi:hypothetical protein
MLHSCAYLWHCHEQFEMMITSCRKKKEIFNSQQEEMYIPFQLSES